MPTHPGILSILILLAALSEPVAPQGITRAPSNSVVDMQVLLFFDDGSPSHSGAVPNTSINGTERSSAGVGTGRESSISNMQIRVQLQDGFGAVLDEKSPNGEGKVLFRVKATDTYRIRVFGSEIDEATVENVQPSSGDRYVNVRLHHRNTVPSQLASAETVAAIRLHAPKKAVKAQAKGTRALLAGDLVAARENLEKAIQLYPDFDIAYNNLGVILMQVGDREGGRRAFTKAVQLNDHFVRAYLNLAKLCIAEKEFTRAHELTRKALSTEPLNPSALFIATEAAFFSDSFIDTIAYARILHSLPHEDFGLVHFLAARALQAQNLPGAAMLEYAAFLKESPGDPNVPLAQQALRELRSPSEDHQ